MKLNKEVKVGVFAVLGIAILIFGYNFLKGYSPLQGYARYYAVYSDVTGIVKSTQVSINGLKVGQVDEIGMLHKGDPSRILVTIIMDNNVKIPRGTEAMISSQDLLGTKAIVVKLAGNAEYLSNGDTLVGTMEESLSSTISKMVSPIKDKSEKVLATLDRVLESMDDIFDSTGTQKLAQGIHDFSGTLRNLNNITHRFDKLTEEQNDKLRGMFVNLESITHNLRNNNEAISRSMKNLSRITDSLAAADLTATINHTRRVMDQFGTALEKINRGEGSLGKLANDKALYDNLNKSSTELSALLKDMQEYPGRYFSVSVFGGSKRSDKAERKREAARQKDAR